MYCMCIVMTLFYQQKKEGFRKVLISNWYEDAMNVVVGV